jgi:MFS family permease
MNLVLQPAQQRIEQANYHHYVIELLWFGLAVAAVPRFIQYYAIDMGATPLELGWLTALPYLVLVISAALSQWWRSRYSNARAALIIPAIGMRFMFLLPAFAPFFPEQWRTVWIILAATLPAFPQGIASTMFWVFMRESIHPDHIAPLITRRLLVMNLSVTAGTIGFGLILETLPFPMNYQLMFVVAFIFAMVSMWHVARVHYLDTQTATDKTPIRHRPWRDVLRDTRFLSTAWIVMVTHLAQTFIAAPLSLQLKQEMGASDGFLAAFGVAELLGGAAATFVAARFIRHYSHRTIVAGGMIGTGISALLLAFAPTLPLMLVGGALANAAWNIAYISILGFFTERTEADDYQTTTLWHQILFAAMFVGPMLGSAIVEIGLSPAATLLIGAGIRVAAGIAALYGLALFGMKRVKPIR